MFTLAHPFYLALIILPWLIVWFVPKAKPLWSSALTLPFYNKLITHIDSQQHPMINITANPLFLSIWLLVVIALSNPQWLGEPMPLAREGRNIMLALDLSGSMAMRDMTLNNQPVTRLHLVKQAATDFVKRRTGDRLGLILFGTKAYLQTPLTFDRQTILMQIAQATVGLAGNTTSIGDALGLAVKKMQAVPEQSRVIILLTDGANNSGMLTPDKACELANAYHIKIYTIGLGAQSNLSQNPFFGVNVNVDLDEKTLKKLAIATNGRYFRATDLHSLNQIYNTIHQLEPVKQTAANIQPQKDYYPWPLGLAWVLLICWLMHQTRLIAPLTRYFQVKS